MVPHNSKSDLPLDIFKLRPSKKIEKNTKNLQKKNTEKFKEKKFCKFFWFFVQKNGEKYRKNFWFFFDEHNYRCLICSYLMGPKSLLFKYL